MKSYFGITSTHPLFSALFSAILFTHSLASAKDEGHVATTVFAPCTSNERIRFAETLPAEEVKLARSAIDDKIEGPEQFRIGFELETTSKNVTMREVGVFLKARAYLTSELYHIAHEKFSEILKRSYREDRPHFATAAAIGCMNEIQKQFPTFKFEVGHLDTFKTLSKLPNLEPTERRALAHAMVIRVKELLNKFDPVEARQIIEALAFEEPYQAYAKALLLQREHKYEEVVPYWKRFIEEKQLPSEFSEDQDTVVIMYARTLYELKKYEHSGNILRLIPRDSNYLATAMSDLGWALLLSGKRKEAIGASFNVQKSNLSRVFAPEAPLVASISLFELCQYARALKNAVYFKRKYFPVIVWYKKLTPAQQTKPYRLLLSTLRKKNSVPNLVLLEWLRSPEFRAHQTESNALYEEKKTAYRAYSKRHVIAKGAQWVKEWRAPMPAFYKSIDQRLKTLGSNLDTILSAITNRIIKIVSQMIDNVQLLEIEIYDIASEDMVWRNINPQYQQWLSKQAKEKKVAGRVWEWGQVPTDPKVQSEIWDDELGFTEADVTDECKNKEKFKNEKNLQQVPQS